MVKHAARRTMQGLHNYLLARQEKDDRKRELKNQKRKEKEQQMAVEQAGDNGQVKGLSDVKFSGQFGVTFTAGGKSIADPEEDDERMEGAIDQEGGIKLMRSLRKQNGLEISKR